MIKLRKGNLAASVKDKIVKAPNKKNKAAADGEDLFEFDESPYDLA